LAGGKADVSAFVHLVCPCSSGPFFPLQIPFFHALVAVGHRFSLKTGLCWTSLKSWQYRPFTLQFSCHQSQRGKTLHRTSV